MGFRVIEHKKWEEIFINILYFRWRYVEVFEVHSTYSFAVFLEHYLKCFPYL